MNKDIRIPVTQPGSKFFFIDYDKKIIHKIIYFRIKINGETEKQYII
jgi:hypothetical protein